MDLKGYQYRGIIHPGPTAMIASINKGGQLKVEAMTDEFVTLEKTHDVMARLDAQVEGDMDEGYSSKRHDANVNAPGRGSAAGDKSNAASADSDKNKASGVGGKKSGGKKRSVGGAAKSSTGGASAKKRRRAT
mmetsp:Transcript_37020/g.75457  ORF Transcript_37020/g.75457 Transcript_37020/m.75457 type:complete len:133 (+) Transcript_37020:131-529(+)